MPPHTAPDLKRFSENLRRLLGLHQLTLVSAGEILAGGVSAQAVYFLTSGKRTPSMAMARDIAALFGLSVERLLEAEFAELLENELSDGDRFRATEREIAERQRVAAKRKPTKTKGE
jgi:DNA-binding XRE family transcriptional regulator